MRMFTDQRPHRRRLVETPDGVGISVREWGDPDGRPILFIHGVAQCHLCFMRQFASEELSGFRLVAYDVRGHGDSDKPEGGHYYQDYRRWADEVQAVIDGAELVRPVLAGWSMGGRIIGQYLTVYGDGRIAGIHLIAARIVADARFSGPGAIADDPGREAGLADDIATAAAFVRACFHRQPAPDDFAFMLAYNIVAWPRLWPLMQGWPPRIDETVAALRRVTVPVLITHGAADTIVLPTAAEFSKELIPHARLSIYGGCGHSPFWEEPLSFNRELAAFAQGVPG